MAATRCHAISLVKERQSAAFKGQPLNVEVYSNALQIRLLYIPIGAVIRRRLQTSQNFLASFKITREFM